MPRYVLDTSALLAVLSDEPGVDTVLGIQEVACSGQAQVWLPFMALIDLRCLKLPYKA